MISVTDLAYKVFYESIQGQGRSVARVDLVCVTSAHGNAENNFHAFLRTSMICLSPLLSPSWTMVKSCAIS